MKKKDKRKTALPVPFAAAGLPELSWDLFRMSGDPGYYMLYRDLIDFDEEDGRFE